MGTQPRQACLFRNSWEKMWNFLSKFLKNLQNALDQIYEKFSEN